MNFSIFDGVIISLFLVSLSVYLIKPSPLYLKLFPLYFLCAMIFGLVQEYIASQHQYNTVVANTFGPIEFCFYFFVIREVLVNPTIRRIILFIIVLFALFAFIRLYFNGGKIGFDAVNYTIGTLITTVLCIFYFIELFQKSTEVSLARQPAFWIITGIFFSAVISYPLYVMQTFMEESTHFHTEASKIIFRNLGAINNIILVLSAILYSIGFLCRIKRSTL